MGKESYDETIEQITNDNKMLSTKIKDAKRLIDSIFDMSLNEVRIDQVIDRLTSDQMLIDEQKPDFSDFVENSQSKYLGYILKDLGELNWV